MPPLNLTDPIITGGEDWLELAVFVDLSVVWTQWVGEVFENALKTAEEEGSEQTISIFDHRMAVQSFGSHFGPMYYSYRAFDQKDLVWWFRKEPIDHENIASVRVRMSGEACLCSDGGAESLVRWVYRFFDRLGSPVRKISVSRADLCIDLPGMDIEAFRKAHFKRHYATRAKSNGMAATIDNTGSVDRDTWGHLSCKGLTLYVGRSPLMMRAYDKLAELEYKPNSRKFSAMVSYRWGGKVPDCATRVEFEIRREAFKARGIDTIEDFFEKRAALAQYLCNDWFRYLVMDPRGEKHPKSIPVHPGWEIVQQGFRNVFPGSMDVDLSPLPKTGCSIDALAAQAFGLSMKGAKCQGKEFRNFTEYMQYVAEEMRDVVKEKHPEWFATSGR